MWELRPLSATADFTNSNWENTKQSSQTLTTLVQNGIPNPYENIKCELGLSN